MLFKLLNSVQYWFRLAVITVFARMRIYTHDQLVSYGNPGANWWVPTDLVENDWLVYSGGVGEDISFDLEIIKKHNCTVFAFDPTPRSIAYVKRHQVKGFNFIPIGLWKQDAMLKFYQPANSQHVSHSVMNLQNTDTYFKAPCLTIRSVLKRLGHAQIDYLKLDIEGAAFVVIDRMLRDTIFPTVVAVEFDQPCSISQMAGCINDLLHNHYQLAKQDHFNFVFIKSR